MNYFTSDKIVRFDDKILISDIVVANVDGYDCFICAGFSVKNDENDENDKNNDKYFIECLRETFTIQNYFIFDKDPDAKNFIPENILFCNLDIDKVRSKSTANLSYFCNTYENIFLKMELGGKEINWLFSLDMYALLKFKQIIIYFFENEDNKLNQNVCFDKLNYTHKIIHIFQNDSNDSNNAKYIRVTYLRKDIYDEYKNDYIDENENVDENIIGITIENIVNE